MSLYAPAFGTAAPLRRLKFCADLINEKVEGADTDLPYVGLENVTSWTGKAIGLEDRKPEDETDGVACLFQAVDVLFGKLRPYLAKSIHVDFDGRCSSELLVLRHAPDMDARFLHFIARLIS